MSRISIPQCFRRVLSWWRRPRPLRTRQRTFKARPRLEWLEDRTTPSTIYHVDAKALAGGDGLTWASAFTNPQQALTLPTLAPGDEIWVAQGMYSPGANRTDSFNLQTGVGIYGGFAGSETSRGQRDPGANPTVLSGGANSYHVVSVPFGVDSTAVLDGFTVSGGTANGSVWQDQIGAGIWDRGSATFSNLMISSNAAGTGGGMFIDAGSTSALSGITFFENSAADSGGAIYNSAGAPTLTNVTFFRNHALNLMSRGGAVFNDAAAPTFTNVTIYGNDAFSGGGGIYNSNSTPTITNAIIWANLATFGSAQIEDGGTSLSTVNYSDIQGGWAGGVGNTGGDPLLTTLNSYTGPTQTVALLPGSAAIDTGTATGTPGADQRGVGRVGATDMGAFESRGFTITVTGGSGQSTLVGTPFVTPLTVKVASASGEPVKSGKVFFTPPGSGASAALSSGSAVINAAGEAGVTATANAISGTYTVNAQTTGSADVGAFALTNTIDATAFAQALVGTGVTIANAVFTGDSQAIGYFDNSSADVGSQIGIPSGVVMASGSVLNRFGPNTVPDVTTDFQQPGDADLDAQITGYTTYDAAKLEFDFTPNQDTLSFQYVFASDEYNEWANTAYNDVFGFFVDGVDIAVIPGTTTAVSVDNINGGNPFGTPPSSHPELFRNNAANDPPGFIPPYNIQYDGFVTILQAVAHVTPGVSHHIKLAIADAGDHILDSAVFLKGGSFVSGSADLSIAVSDAPDPVGVGQPLVYTITVHNGSSEAASGVIVSDSLPAAIAANPTISASGWSVTLNPDSHVLNAIVDNPLAPGASASFTVTVTPTVPGTLSSFVRLSANEADEGQDDNQVSVSTTVFAGGDATPPTTTATPSAAPNVDGWNSTDVTVTLNATDNPGGSGVQATYYTINGGATQTGTSVTLNSDGKYDIQYWSVDNANNAETPKTLSVWIDKTLPTLTGSFSGTPGANGWYISAGQGALEATDAGSGLAGAIEFTFDGSPPMLYTGPQWIDVEGTHTIVATVSDVAGNVATETFYINIDWTLPTAIPGGPYVAHPGNGVTLSGLASSDNIGVDTYSWLVKGVPLSGATPTLTAAQVNALGLGTFDVSLTVTDLAGNSSAVANTSLSVEETPSLEVTTTDDVVANDGKTSLREAITYANSHPGDDIITFAPGLTGAINLSPAEGGQGALPLTTNVTIDGSGASIILEGGSAKGGIDNIRVMTVNNAVVAYLNNLTIRYGRTWADPSDAWNWSGAGIRNQGALTIANCTFTGNTAAGYGGAIANRFGSLTVSNSTFVDNSTELGQGAALFNDNEVYAGTQMSVTNSTIANNTGAIVSYAPLSVVNCTIVNNTGSLGGIVSHSSVTLTNTLLAQNAAADYWGNPVNAASSNNLIQVESGSGLSDGLGGNIIGVGVTFVGLDPNGLQGHGGPTPTIALLPGSQAINAGTSSSGVVIIPSTDQRGLSRAAGTDIGAFESHGFTIGVTGGDGQTATVNHAFAQALAVKVTANDSLEPVQGGQVTFTAPVGGASAILTGTPATIAADGSASVTAMANGVVGPYAVSAGGAGIATPASFALSNASEGELPSLVVTTTEDVVANDGQTSLREAIAYAETLTGPQIVDATGVAGTINLNSALPALTGEITIAGPGAVSLFVDASHVTGGVSAWSVSSGATITISGLTIQGGVATDGGGIYNSGTLALHSMVITGNRASHFGGGIYNAGSLTIENSLIATNDALSSGQGGGIQNAGAASLTITNSTVTGNRASFYGGGISSGGALTIINATIAANQVTGGYGGGISASQTFTLLNSIVAGNTGGSPDISCGLAIAVNYSLIQSTSGNGNFAPGSSHYITGVSPLLASLANNGGPTQTMALRFGSPAINAGTTGVGVPGVDQRGTTRDATPDMGAYEFVGVASASSTSPDGAYKAGVIVPITVAFTQNVFVAGAPQLTLNDGAVVDYSTGSGTTTLTFNYTVSAGQNTSDLDYLSATALALNGGTIKDSVGNDVTLTLPNPGAPGSLGANKNLIIDTIAPTINAARDGLDYALAHGGWNNFNITASYTASDGGSGLASPATGSQLFSSDGAAQSVTFTVYDLAGNSASATVSDINIDRTAPTLTGDFSGTPGANGWFVSAGMGSLTGGDSLSGVAGVEYSADGIVYLPYTGPVPISDEGAHTVYGRVTDAAGNQTTQSFAVNIDWTPPTTTATLTPGMPDGLHDWYVSDVTIGFFAGDVTSGVARTEYSTDNVTWTTGTSLTLSTDGFHTIWYRSEDVAGNTESAHALDLKIDKTAPTISASAKKADGTPYVSPGWTAQDVTVTFTGDAGVSGLDSLTGPVTLSAEGAGQSVIGTITDLAGHSASHTLSGINIDKTAPVVTVTPDRGPDSNGWYNHAINFTVGATDALSGVVGQDPDFSYNGPEGSDVSAGATAVDQAGNFGTGVFTFHYDTTAPITTTTLTPAAPNGSNNWYVSDVSIAFSASDNASGVASTEYSVNGGAWTVGTALTLSAEGVYTVSYRSVDAAGNTETAQSLTVKIDKAPPVTTATVTPATPNGNSGWYVSDVTITLSATDTMSGVAVREFSTDNVNWITPSSLTFTDDGVHTVWYRSWDNAGHIEAAQSLTVKIDKTGPTLTGSFSGTPGANGWYTSAGDGALSASDASSGVAGIAYSTNGGVDFVPYTGPVPISDEGMHSIVAKATDEAGNVTTTVFDVNIDWTPPAVTLTPERGPDSGGWYNHPIGFTVAATDSVSGVGAQDPNFTYSGPVGAGVMVSATATDVAGNVGTASFTFNYNDVVEDTVLTAPDGLGYSVDGNPYTGSHTFSFAYGSTHTIATTSLQGGLAGTQYVWSNWSDGGAISHTIIANTQTTYTANFTTQYLLLTGASPSDGGSVGPASGYYDAGQTVTLSATANPGYTFTGWTGSGLGSYTGSNPGATITMNGPVTEAAQFKLSTVQTTVTTGIDGLSFNVDGTTYSSAQTFSWVPGSLHAIATTSVQPGGLGTQYVWSNWSDGGAIAHTITADTPTTYTANFTTQYLLITTSVPPGAGGSVGPVSGFYNAGQTVALSATANPGYTFVGWTGAGSGSYTGSNPGGSVTMNGPITESAQFQVNTVQATVTTGIAGLSFGVDGVTYSSAQTFTWDFGSQHTIATTSPQSGAAGTQYVWSDWSDGGAMSHTITATAPTTYTANFTTQYLLTTAASPGAGGSVGPASGYYNAGQTVVLSASANAGYSFTGWTGSGSGAYTGSSPGGSVTMNAPITETAGFVTGTDFGDAPAPYPTLLPDGARHALGGPRLGAGLDAETDGQPNASATGDKYDDGVTFLSPFVAYGTEALNVNVQNAPSGAMLDAWIDWNHDGDWSDPGEQIAASLAMGNGDHVLTIPVPADAAVNAISETFARFRLSTGGGLLPTGFVNNGEVEDYMLSLRPAPSDVYVDAAFSGTPGTVIPDADPAVDGAQPATLGADAFATIQQAINVVAPGGRVHVANGTYGEALSIGKSLSLLGQSAAGVVLQGAGSGTGLNVSAPIVSISNLTAQNFATGLSAVNMTSLNLTDVRENGNTSAGAVTKVVTVNFTGADTAETYTVNGTRFGRADALLSYSGVTNLNVSALGGADVITVNGTASGTALQVDTGAGDDVIEIEAPSARLGNMLGGPVTVNAGAGTNKLRVSEANCSAGDVITILPTQILGEGPFPFTINYSATGGSFANGIYVDTGWSDDWIRIRGTPAAPLTVSTSTGDEHIDIDAPSGRLGNVLGGPVSIDAGPGVNQLHISEANCSAGDVITVLPTQIIGEGPFPFTINYSATGGSFAGGFDLTTGYSDDWVRVHGTPALSHLKIYTGAGNDHADVEALSGRLGNVLAGQVSVDAGAGSNEFHLSEAACTAGDVLTIYASQILGEGPFPFLINYVATGGTFSNVQVTTGSNDDWLRVRGKPPVPFMIDTGAGNDVMDVYVSPTSFYSNLWLDGGAGSNSLTAFDLTGGYGVGAVMANSATSGDLRVTYFGMFVSDLLFQNVPWGGVRVKPA